MLHSTHRPPQIYLAIELFLEKDWKGDFLNNLRFQNNTETIWSHLRRSSHLVLCSLKSELGSINNQHACIMQQSHLCVIQSPSPSSKINSLLIPQHQNTQGHVWVVQSSDPNLTQEFPPSCPRAHFPQTKLRGGGATVIWILKHEILI